MLEGIVDSLRRLGGSKELLQKVLDTIPQTVFWKDRNLRYLGCNQLFAENAGKSCPEELIGLNDFDLPWDREEAEFYRSCDLRVIDSSEAEIGIIESQINADGKLTWLETNKAPLHDDTGEVIGVLGTYQDITRLKQAEEILQRNNEELERRVSERTRELKFVADHDGLTGLANRGHFVQRLNELLGSPGNEKIALMFIDLDNFKPINDSDGHEAGDQLLVQVSRILQTTLGPRDFAGRFGGDEFLVLMRDMKYQHELERVCQEILRQMNFQIAINGRTTVVSASIGIVFCDSNEYQNSDDLLNNADLAMYSAKRQGKNSYCFFTESLRTAIDMKANIQKHLIAGINERQFVLHYQPIIDLKQGKIYSFEALVRWQHPERGLLFPGDFISKAESTGLIVQLGQQIMEAACQQLALWQCTMGNATKDLMMNVNLSPRQLLEPRFVDYLIETVESFGVDPSLLCLEITESLLMNDTEAAIRTLQKIRGFGFQLHLDDFGSGYSSLNYLDELPVDALKIDRTFVNKLENHHRDNAVVRMILALAETLNVGVVAEGVETEFQVEALKSMDCNVLQGYYYAKPMPADIATQYILDHQNPESFQLEQAVECVQPGPNKLTSTVKEN